MAATLRRDLKEPVAPVERSLEERVTFRWRRFLLLTYLVVTASTAQLCLMTQDEIRERKLRKHRRQEIDSIDRPHSIEQRACRENAYLEWMTYLSCGARWSRKTGRDDIQVKMGTDNRTTLADTSLSRMCLNDATTTDDKQNEDVLRMQSVHPVQKSGMHISHYGITCCTVCALVFSSSAYGGAGDGTGLRLSRIGRELQNVECSSRTSCNTTGTRIPSGTATASFVFWHHGSGSTTGDRSNVSRQRAEYQGEHGSSDQTRHNAEDLNSTGVLQSVRVWTNKTDDNAAPWEAAIRHSNKVSVSSCFLMSATIFFDDSIFGGYIGSLVKNAAGFWEPAMKTKVSQNRCRVFGKSPWWDLSCDDDVWLHEQATMNRAQNSLVDEQLAQIQTAHDELLCYFADHKTMQIRPATTYDLTAESRICLLDLRDAPNCELEGIRQHIRNMQPYMLTAQHNDDSPNDESLRALCEQQANQGGYFLLNLRSCPKEQDSTWDTSLGFRTNLPGLIRPFAELGEDLHLHFDSAKRVAEAVARFQRTGSARRWDGTFFTTWSTSLTGNLAKVDRKKAERINQELHKKLCQTLQTEAAIDLACDQDRVLREHFPQQRRDTSS